MRSMLIYLVSINAAPRLPTLLAWYIDDVFSTSLDLVLAISSIKGQRPGYQTNTRNGHRLKGRVSIFYSRIVRM